MSESYHVHVPYMAVGENADGVAPCTSFYRAFNSDQAFEMIGHLLGHVVWAGSQLDPDNLDHLDKYLAIIKIHAKEKLDGLLSGQAGITPGVPLRPTIPPHP